MTNLIENNAYRTLGLDINANQKEILKRYKELINRLKIDDYPEFDLDLNLPKKFRNETNVNDALKRLQSQKSNIKEYFFWFSIDDSNDKKALKFVQEENFDGAIQIWKTASKGDNASSYICKKNLALLYTLLLFNKNNATNLKESLSLWHELINSEKFWTIILKKYASSNEQEANSESFQDFRKSAVKNISDIYAELHKLHKDNKYVKDFQEIFGTHGERTEKNVLQPIYQSLYDNIEELQKIKIHEDKEVSEKEIKSINKIVDSIQEDLSKLEEIGVYHNDSSKIVRDHVADGIRAISIALHNYAGEYKESLMLLKFATKISGTESLKKILNSELKKIEKNPYIHCWFCNDIIKKGDENNGLHEHWHQITGTENDFWGNTKRIRFQKFESIIPRCERCQKAHDKYEFITGCYIFASVIFGGFLIWLLQIIGDLSWVIGPLIGLASYFVLKGIGIGGLKEIQENTKPKNYRSEYPIVKELIQNGWQRGEEPSN
jgi:hypothetical protein